MHDSMPSDIYQVLIAFATLICQVLALKVELEERNTAPRLSHQMCGTLDIQTPRSLNKTMSHFKSEAGFAIARNCNSVEDLTIMF